MNQAIERYQELENARNSTQRYDKVVTVEGVIQDSRDYRKSLVKPKEDVRTPLVGSTFSRFLDGFM